MTNYSVAEQNEVKTSQVFITAFTSARPTDSSQDIYRGVHKDSKEYLGVRASWSLKLYFTLCYKIQRRITWAGEEGQSVRACLEAQEPEFNRQNPCKNARQGSMLL